MKNFIFLILMLTIHSMLFAYNVQNGWKYEVIDGRAYLYGVTGVWTPATSATGNVTIPSTLGGYPVVGVEPTSLYSSQITSLTFPDSVKIIEYQAINSMFGLTSITFPNYLIYLGANNITMTKLTSLTFPDTLESIETGVATSNNNLTTVHLPKNCRTIGKNAISYCPVLKTINMNANYPPNLSVIEDDAFAGTGFSQITLPETLTYLGSSAFTNCRHLKEVIFAGPPPTTGREGNLFSGSSLDIKGYYSSAYRSQWSVVINDGKWNGLSMVEVGVSTIQKIDLATSGNGIVTTQMNNANTQVTLTAAPSGNNTFLGWQVGSNILQENPVTVAASNNMQVTAAFAPTSLLEAYTEEIVEAGAQALVAQQLNSGDLLTKESAAQQTQTAIDQQLSDGILFNQEGVNKKIVEATPAIEQAAIEAAKPQIEQNAIAEATPRIKEQAIANALITKEVYHRQDAIDEALANDEVYTKDEMQAIAYGDPVIEVVNGKASVGIALQKATSLNGDWKMVTVTEPSATDDGKILVEVEPEEGETTAFYRFVVGDEEETESEESTEQ